MVARATTTPAGAAGLESGGGCCRPGFWAPTHAAVEAVSAIELALLSFDLKPTGRAMAFIIF